MTLKEIREEKKYSQVELAKKIGISPQRLSNYEKGKRKTPTKIWWKVFEALELTQNQRMALIREFGREEES